MKVNPSGLLAGDVIQLHDKYFQVVQVGALTALTVTLSIPYIDPELTRPYIPIWATKRQRKQTLDQFKREHSARQPVSEETQ